MVGLTQTDPFPSDRQGGDCDDPAAAISGLLKLSAAASQQQSPYAAVTVAPDAHASALGATSLPAMNSGMMASGRVDSASPGALPPLSTGVAGVSFMQQHLPGAPSVPVAQEGASTSWGGLAARSIGGALGFPWGPSLFGAVHAGPIGNTTSPSSQEPHMLSNLTVPGAIHSRIAGVIQSWSSGGKSSPAAQKQRRAETARLVAQLDVLCPLPRADVPRLERESGEFCTGRRPGHRTLKSGRSQEELFMDVRDLVRDLVMRGTAPREPSDKSKQAAALASIRVRDREALDLKDGFGLLCVDTRSSEVRYASKVFSEKASWLKDSGLCGLQLTTVLAHADCGPLRKFLAEISDRSGTKQRRMKGDAESDSHTNPSVGRSITLRFLQSPPGERGLRAPNWLLVVSPNITLRVADVTLMPARDSTRGLVPVAVLVADLANRGPLHVGVQAAHARNCVESGLYNFMFDVTWDKNGMDPFEINYATRWYDPNASERKLGLGGNVARIARKAASGVASMILRNGMAFRLAAKCNLDDDDNLTCTIKDEMRFVGGGCFRKVEIFTLGKWENVPAPPVELGSPNSMEQICFLIVDPDKQGVDHSMMWNVWMAPRDRQKQGYLGVVRAHIAGSREHADATVEAPWSTGHISEMCVVQCTPAGLTGGSGDPLLAFWPGDEDKTDPEDICELDKAMAELSVSSERASEQTRFFNRGAWNLRTKSSES